MSSTKDEAVVVGLDYLISHANQAVMERAGMPLAAAVGKPCYEILHNATSPPNEHLGKCPISEAFETGQTVVEIHRRFREGYRLFVEVEGRPLVDPDGNTVAGLCLSRELGLSECYQRIFDTMQDGVLVIGRNGRLVDVNSAICQMLGYTKEELVSQRVVDFMGADLAIAWPESPGESSPFLEMDLPRKDGSSLPVEITVSRLALGSVTLFVAFARDNSRRKDWESTVAGQPQALAVSEARYKALFVNASDAMMVLESDTTIAMVNLQFEEMTGYRGEEIEGKMTFLPLLRDQDRERILTNHHTLIDQPLAPASQLRYWVVGKAGQTWLAEVSAAVIPGSKRVLMSMRDVTEDQLRQEQLLRRNREAEILYAVATLVSRTSNLDTTLQGVLEKALEFTKLDRGYIFLMDDELQKLFVRASSGSSAGDEDRSGGLDPGQGFAGWVAKTGEPLFAQFAASDPLRPHSGAGADSQTVACVPVVAGGKTLGVMGLSGSGDRDYTLEEQRLLVSIGGEVGAAVERASLLQKAQQRARELESLMSMTREMASTLDLNEVLDRTLAIMCGQIGANNGFVCLLEEEQSKLTTRAFWGDEAVGLRKIWKWKVGEGVVGWVALHQQGIVCDDVSADRRITNTPGADLGYRSIVAVPLRVKENLLGVVAAVSKETAAFTGADLRLLTAYAAEASMALENALLHQEVRKQASTDDLTHLTNRRYFYMRLEEELKRARRYGHPVSLLFLDVDDLKQVNDRYGHLQGDDLLRHVGSTLTAVLRASDVAARFGGDEFVILLPETGREEASRAAERLLAEAAPCPLLSGGSIPLSMSIGVSWLPMNGSYDVDLLRLADEAVYRAKQQGTGWDYARPEVKQAQLPLDGGQEP
ncbi:MAG: diguanylate cyclase [Dehalococcoidia bacterium]|nr:diguanylate cyclase [Dehalococcoidia bacterium]